MGNKKIALEFTFRRRYYTSWFPWLLYFDKRNYPIDNSIFHSPLLFVVFKRK